MSPPFFSDVFKGVNDLFNKDFYHGTPASVDLETVAKNGVKFNVKAKQLVKEGPLAANVDAKFFDKATGLTLTQGWSNSNVLTTKIELAELTPGLKTELLTSLVPNISKAALLNLSFVQPFFTARGNFDLLKGPSFIGDMTLAHESGVVAGAQFGYDIAAGSLSKYAVALGYGAQDYHLGLNINNDQVTTATFFQNVSQQLQVGTRATLNPRQTISNVNIEFATKYLPDPNSQVKARISDAGVVGLSYKQVLRPGVILGVGTSFDALKLSEPVHKLGWSLSFAL
ncbi:porin POR1 [Nakaseomyces bracarensis]|uniref:porin POR1 n=1 Tax=Nakaseomyces bracarensis TaxID=273131 RepID=UPI003871FDF8